MNTDKNLEYYGFDESHLITSIKGGNSLIYKCRTSAGSYVGVKLYLGDYHRCVRSMEREVESLNFLYENKFAFVSRLIAFNPSTPSICYEWIEGETPNINSLVKNQVISALVNLNSLYELNPNFPPAIDALPSASALRKQIANRISQAKIYLQNYPATFKALEKAVESKTSYLQNYEKLPVNTFSFSDIGVHNMVMNSKSELYFLDFEFFGTDSKVKMLCDLFAHPKTIFSKDEIFILAHKLCVTDYEFNCILKILPEIAVKWALITSRRVSNEFLVDKKSVNLFLEQINHFLDYSMHLGQIKTFDEVLTFPEYKKMQ
jgi:hypothetical protein